MLTTTLATDARDWISRRGVARLLDIHIDNVPRFAAEAKVRVMDLPGGFKRRYNRADVEAALAAAIKRA